MTILQVGTQSAAEMARLTDVVRPIVAVEDVETALSTKVSQLKTGQILAAAPKEHEPSVASLPWVPVNLVGTPEQAVGTDQHHLIIAQYDLPPSEVVNWAIGALRSYSEASRQETAMEDSADKLGLGRLERLDPRQVWKNEAADLTPWLLENVEVLAGALGIEIVPTQREVRVGDFKLDIIGEDPGGQPIIIENQLEPTDHSHLGQLIVYASGLEAAVVVWLTPRFRDEHRRALDWLNERTDENVNFFGVELELVRIGESAPAPSFRLVAEPNDWQKAVKRQTGVSDKSRLRHDFFEQAFDKIQALRPNFNRPKAGYDNWTSMASGPFGYYALSFATGNRLRVEVYLDLGTQESTKILFDKLFGNRVSIEEEFTFDLAWERLDDKRASRIATYREAPELSNKDEASSASDWSARAIVELIEILDERLRLDARTLRA